MTPTPEIVRACYELLNVTRPYNLWKLPPASEVKFAVTRHRDRGADWAYDGRHTIRVSACRAGHLGTVLRNVGHEMAHMRQHRLNPLEREHGSEFLKACRSICKWHPYWDYPEFIV